eukprot:SAG22_NODE_18_length_32591_cov_38.043549_5_plen_70_part_00
MLSSILARAVPVVMAVPVIAVPTYFAANQNKVRPAASQAAQPMAASWAARPAAGARQPARPAAQGWGSR